MKNNFLILIFALSYLQLGFGQESFLVPFEWKTEPQIMQIEEEEKISIPNLTDGYFDSEHFFRIYRIEKNASSKWILSLKNFSSSAINSLDQQFINRFDLNIPEDILYKVKNIKEMGKPVVSISIFPYVKQNGVVRKLTSVEFSKSAEEYIPMKTGHEFAANSVLAPGSGDWYKIRVPSTGIYRISYNFLKDIGIDIDNINPSSINIYGNGFGILPERNDVFRPDDLLKNAIFVQGEQDGSFDSNDFILFYGRGPHKWEDEGNAGFRRRLNIYADYSVYFININANAQPKRIQTVNATSLQENQLVTSYNSFAIHEQELVNLMRGGQRWYGELFDAELEQSFSFSIPHLDPQQSPIVRSFMACRQGSSGGTTNFQLLHNGNVIGSSNLGPSQSDSYSRSGLTTMPNAFNPSSGNFSIQVRFNRANPSDFAHLDYIEINARSFLRFSGNQFEFRDKNSVGSGNISRFRIENFPQGASVWETTDLANPRIVSGEVVGANYEFTLPTDSLRSFIAFRSSNFLTPTFMERAQHQNLHALGPADYLIVTHKDFLAQAQRLANLHATQGLSSHVVELQDIYNEFSGGTQDPTAIKFFAKMFYDRADGDPELSPKYLCLFGSGSYDPLDRIANNNYLCPVYHTLNSESYTASIVSDDYFGFLDDEEEFSPDDLLDIAVGRLIASTPKHAVDLVNKIEHYMKNGSDLFATSGVLCGEDGFISTQGDWRLRVTSIADDEDDGYFITSDLEPIHETLKENFPEMNPNKIYLDAFQQITTAGGQRYPDVNREINRSIEAGTLVMSYVGHGGPSGAAQERVITIGQINDWTNISRLTLFASATCEFSRIDDPGIVSAGEWMALNPIGGAIALMTTTRAVFVSANTVTTARFFDNVFLRDENFVPRTFGEIITSTKNQIPGGSNNKRAFMLLGDPALKIALPYQKIVLDSINGNPITSELDTLRALSKTKMAGHIEDQFGNHLSNFNGILQPSVFDKPQLQSTLGQDLASPVIEFEQQLNILYRGRVSVNAGNFNFEFIVPRDIDFNFGRGKASFYAFDDQNESGGGYSKDLIIGGIDTTGVDDNIGPEIELYLNDDSFVNGGITNETPVLIAKLFDESGINTVGTGIGHDITVVLNDETSNAKVLNQFYEADLDTYQSGSLRYQFERLEPGLHTLTFKAWDVNNNSSEAKLEFTVQESQDVALRHVLNYPNPFTTSTTFMFEHNQVCAALETKIEIFTVTGRLVRTIHQDVQTQGFRVEGIPWDGRDDFGDQLAKGVYVYRVSVRNPDGNMATEMQKMYLLK